MTQDTTILEHVADRLALTGDARGIFLGAATLHRFPAHARVIEAGQSVSAYLYVVTGSVRMQLIAANGRVVTLLRIEADSPCVLTTSCLFAHRPYPVEGITESEVRALTLPAHVFDALFAASPPFREAVLRTFSERVGEIIVAMETNLFDSIPARLARALVAAGKDGTVRQTHAELAAEIGSAREVISRQLSRFAERGLIALHRGTIEILDRPALRREGEAGQ